MLTAFKLICIQDILQKKNIYFFGEGFMYAVSAEDQELYNKGPPGGIQLFIQTVWGKLEKVPFLYTGRVPYSFLLRDAKQLFNQISKKVTTSALA